MAGPTVVRRQLGRTLKRIRTAAGISVDQVVAHRELGISRAKLYRLEAGEHPVKPQDIVVLCQFFGTSSDDIKRLTAMALATQNHSDAAIPEWFQLFRDLEPIASRIRTYEGDVIPGELQTEDYARAVYRATQPDNADQGIEHHVAIRLDRQDKLYNRKPAPRLTTILNEAVLTRPVGGVTVIEAQREHLHELDQRGSVQIRVLPFEVGAHAAMTGAFRILDFDDPDDPNIVYLEAQVGVRYLQKRAEYDEYERIWKLIHRQSVPLKEFHHEHTKHTVGQGT